MTVIDILVLKLGFACDSKAVFGKVQITLSDAASGCRTMNLDCTCQSSARVRPDALLIGDAIRQLRRMPEIRSGADRLKFADGLKPLQSEIRVA